MDQLDGRPRFARHPAIAPAHQGDDDGVEVAPLLRETVLVAWRAILIAHALEHTRGDQTLQTVGQPVPGESDGAEVVEAADAEEGVAQDDQGPASDNHR